MSCRAALSFKEALTPGWVFRCRKGWSRFMGWRIADHRLENFGGGQPSPQISWALVLQKSASLNPDTESTTCGWLGFKGVTRTTPTKHLSINLPKATISQSHDPRPTTKIRTRPCPIHFPPIWRPSTTTTTCKKHTWRAACHSALSIGLL
jgi:hypothetical protein